MVAKIGSWVEVTCSLVADVTRSGGTTSKHPIFSLLVIISCVQSLSSFKILCQSMYRGKEFTNSPSLPQSIIISYFRDIDLLPYGLNTTEAGSTSRVELKDGLVRLPMNTWITLLTILLTSSFEGDSRPMENSAMTLPFLHMKME